MQIVNYSTNNCTFTKIGLNIQKNISYEDWQKVGGLIVQIYRSSQWWIGDWLNFGENKWGEMYSQALESTPYSYRTLATAKWVSNKIEMARRRETLSFSHHKEVAALEPAEQIKMLKKAEENGLTHKDLRLLINNKNGDADKVVEVITCPFCNKEFEV